MTEVWTDIERIEFASTREFWTGPGKARKPVVVENSASTWRAQGAWTLDYLRQAVGRRTLLEPGDILWRPVQQSRHTE